MIRRGDRVVRAVFSVWEVDRHSGRGHWQPCGSDARGLCLALYSPVKACSVSSLKAVQ